VSESVKGSYEENESATLQEGVRGATIASASYASWLMDSARQKGDVTAIQAGSGYNVILFLDRYLVTDPTVDMRHILIRPETADDAKTNESGVKVPTAEAMEAAKTKAQTILDEWKAGEATEESFAALAEEHSGDSRDSEGNLANPVYDHVQKGSFTPNIDAWLFDSARKPGDVGLVDYNEENGNYYGWHVVYYVGQNEPYWKKAVTDAKTSTEQSAWLKETQESVTGEAADGMQYVGAANTATPTPSATPAESVTPTDSAAPAESTAPSESATPTESVEPSPAQ